MIDRKDCEAYLIRLYFGDSDDLLGSCINRAYRDFNRTIHGIDRLDTKIKLYQEASGYLKKSFSDIQTGCVCIAEQEEFDRWHEVTCLGLSRCYNKHGYRSFSFGQGQKWINMTFKYIFTMGEDRIAGFNNLYRFCHIPIDNIILQILIGEYEFPRLSCAWSRINNYGEYLSCQKWFRQKFSADDALDVEYRMWMIGTGSNGEQSPLVKVNNEKTLAIDSDTKGRSIGPYRRNRMVLCSADASPDSQATTACEAAYFFPKAKWVGAVRNAANYLMSRFVILTTAHGMVNPHDRISPYDLKAENNEIEVAKIWRDTVTRLLGSNQCDIIVFYAGGCRRKPYLDLLLPILRDMKIDFIVFGKPNMYDSGKIGIMVEMLEQGSSIQELKSILKNPEGFLFVPWRDKDAEKCHYYEACEKC